MKNHEINNIRQLYFSTVDIAKTLSISKESAKVTASRYAKKNIIIRLKKNIYILANRIPSLTEDERFKLANIIQTPSYISLTTALSYYNISTQQQRNFIESIALKKTKSINVNDITFFYTLIKKDLYRGFNLHDGFFIATPEKALADSIYLTSLKRYNCDFEAINFKKLNKQIIDKFITKTNKITQAYWRRICTTYNI